MYDKCLTTLCASVNQTRKRLLKRIAADKIFIAQYVKMTRYLKWKPGTFLVQQSIYHWNIQC